MDASIALAWCLEDEVSPYADSVLASSGSIRLAVPQHWTLEIANVLALAVRAGRTPATGLADAASLLGNLAIDVDPETYRAALGATGALGRKHALTAYDAAYLELAIRLGTDLASLDKRLVAAANAEGIDLFQP